MNTQKITYDDKSVRWFMIASIIWGLVGMLVGVIVATQLNRWEMNGKFLEIITFGAIQSEGVSFLTFGRLRPLHTNATIFAFVGNMMFAGIYYSTQRLCKARTASDLLTKIHFWGWQLIIVAAAITLPLGYTQGQEYAELIWPIDIAIALIWVVFAVNFFMTLARRNEPSLYVALWFYIATIITVALLHIVNSLHLPTSFLHSYPVFGGVQNALVQWWYGHNAVAFFLTTPILGIMYYFLPKAAGRPVYSYRLSIIHFWSLVFIYIWAGPHHLLNTALPKWLQLLGMLFSLMLWAPSWGGMLNGLLTLRGAWDKLRTDPVIKFFAVGVTFYGMATFEGPLLSIRAVNQLSHYSDWTIGHVHSGTLGWNGFMAAGMFYWLVPKLWKTNKLSVTLANFHFWIGLVGILLYVASMWFSGIGQGLMLGATDATGTVPKYAQFAQTLEATMVPMGIRAVGGLLYLIGFLLLAFNVFRAISGARVEDQTAEVAILSRKHKDQMSWRDTFMNDPVVHTFWFVVFLVIGIFLPPYGNVAAFGAAGLIAWRAVVAFRSRGEGWISWHERLLENYLPFTILALVSVAAGGLIQIVPSVLVNKAENVEDRLQELYTPLELAGRDIYVSEGCYNCHSQMIRTLVTDVMRYGDYSRLGESIYDHPFQWGSKRTGPDLAREGGLRSNLWHYQHMVNPRDIERLSTMPSYPWLVDSKTNFKAIPGRIKTQVKLGVPFTDNFPTLRKDEIEQHARDQALEIAANLVQEGANVPDTEELSDEELTAHLSERQIVALIAYLQKLGSWEPVGEPIEGEEVPIPETDTPHILNPDQKREDYIDKFQVSTLPAQP